MKCLLFVFFSGGLKLLETAKQKCIRLSIDSMGKWLAGKPRRKSVQRITLGCHQTWQAGK